MSAEKGGSRLPPEAASQLHKKLDNPNASKKVHDYLQMQQRKKEDYWMRKFGRLIDPLPGKVGGAAGSGSPPSRAGELPPLAMGMNASPRITNTGACARRPVGDVPRPPRRPDRAMHADGGRQAHAPDASSARRAAPPRPLPPLQSWRCCRRPATATAWAPWALT
jgi:hypothetical protein